MRRLNVAIGVIALATSAACTVHQTEVPPLTGPSELALSLTVSATPDSILQDGASQSSIAVLARNVSGKPVSGLALRLDMAVDGVVQDYGTLSSRTIVTNADGRATAVFTAPPAPPAGAGGSGNRVSILVTPIGTNGQVSVPSIGPASIPSMVDIRLVPPGVIRPPAGTPTANFVFSPTPITVGASVLFDATASAVGSGASQIVSYSWTFGDGYTATGATCYHKFETAGSFQVTLTVTNDRGMSASTTQSVTASPAQAPTPAFDFSPTTPAVNQSVYFNASTTKPGTGRGIVSYKWDFGDGSPSASGVQTSHVYTTVNTFKVTLTVTDDLGQTESLAKDVAIK